MEHRAPDGDPTEGLEIVDDLDDEGVSEEGPPIPNPNHRHQGTHLSRVTRWKRTITITGPPAWVDSTRLSSLAQGIHQVGVRDGIPCFIEVDTEDGDTLRFMNGPTPNQAMVDLRLTDPKGYEEIHGPGTALSHADHNEADHRRPSTRPVTDTHVGQYL